MTAWLDGLGRTAERGERSVVVTLALVKGSTPREAGAKMVVTGAETFGTIGGGHLEYEATAAARALLADERAGPLLRRLPLGPELGQCCGGTTELLLDPVDPAEARPWLDGVREAARAGRPFVLVTLCEGRPGRLVVTSEGEAGGIDGALLDDLARSTAAEMLAGDAAGAAVRLLEGPRPGAEQAPRLLFDLVRPSDLDIVLFGAGHVAKSLVAVLAELPCRITWVDEREEQFPRDLPANVGVEVSDAPEYDVDEAAPGSYFLVMTHSHALDLKLARRILGRGDFAYFGLIGSQTKRRRFEKRLRNTGVPDPVLARMTCPIGIAGIPGKHPREIAVAVAAEILHVRGERRAEAARRDIETLSA